jgi:GrpB-like predicted nucleotidyltransferase (UPF0157 family)
VKDAPVEIVPYSPEWPQLFESEARLLLATLGPWLAGEVQHVGSTAVPGLSAKPIIDIVAPVRSLAEAAACIDPLRSLGYCYSPYKPEEMLWFCKPSPERRTHHLHVMAAASSALRERLAFRDALRRSPALASEYELLKIRLAGTYAHDREAYTQAKAPFIESVLSRVVRSEA